MLQIQGRRGRLSAAGGVRVVFFRINVDANRFASEQLEPEEIDVQPTLEGMALIVTDRSGREE